jgi:hypothetical protein
MAAKIHIEDSQRPFSLPNLHPVPSAVYEDGVRQKT